MKHYGWQKEAEKQAQENERLQELSKQGPMANAEDLLRTGQISQKEFEHLVSTIEGGRQAELQADSSNDFHSSRNRAESESTHNPLKAAEKMLAQGVITQDEFDEIAGKINQAKREQDDGVSLVASPSASVLDDSVNTGQEQSSESDDESIQITLPPMPDDNDTSSDDISDRNDENQNLNPLMENHLSKMRGYLDKQNKHHSLKWNRRWFTAQFLEDPTIMM